MSQLYLQSPSPSRYSLPSRSPSRSRSSASTSSDNTTTLPFPEPLPRSDFLTSDFDPSEYLSTLTNRHQTLEDLRADLRTRSQQLSQELLELVNGHYQDFLSLGGALKGGEEKVEELNVGVLGVRREVEGLRGLVRGREEEIRRLVEDRRRIRSDIEFGRGLVEWAERVGRLEERLMLTGGKEEKEERDDESEDEESLDGEILEDEDEDEAGEEEDILEFARLKRRVVEYVAIQRRAEHTGLRHPLILANQERMMRLRNTLLLDLRAALRQSKMMDVDGPGSLLKVLSLYRQLNASKEAVDAVNSLPKR